MKTSVFGRKISCIVNGERMYYYISALLELIKIYLVIRLGFGIPRREKRSIFNMGVIGLAVVYGSICAYIGNDVFWIYLIWLLSEIILLFYYSLKSLLAIGFGMICFVGMLDSLSLLNIKIINVLFGFRWNQRIENVLASFLTVIFFILVFLVVLKKESGEFQKIGTSRLLEIFLVGFLYSMVLALIWDKVLTIGSAGTEIKIYAIFLVISVSAYYQLIVLVKLAISNKKLQERDAMNQYFLQLQENQYLYLKNTEQETKKFRHDMKNHMFVLVNLCRDGEIDKLTAYIEEVWGKMDLLTSGYHVNHSIVDAILNQYSFQCRTMGIRFDVKGRLPVKCKISSYDICTLFSNILQNAYEAASACERKEIVMKLRFDEDCIYIEEENTYQVDIKVTGGIFLSAKEDTANHGFGMQNMKECIRKYRGEWNYKTSMNEAGEKRFLLQIMVYNKSLCKEETMGN